MIKIIKELNVEVTKPNIFQAIVAKQYDMNTRFLKVTFVDCGTRIDIPFTDTTKVVINAERTDGQSKGFDGEINKDGTVIVPLHSWMLELEGTVICDISVIDTKVDDEKKLTTTSFNLIVEKAAYGGDDITSDPQYDVLVELIDRVEKLETGDVSNKMDKFGRVVNEASATKVIVSEDGKSFILYSDGSLIEIECAGFTVNCGMLRFKASDYEVISTKDGNLKLTRLVAPTNDTDAVNKIYVDNTVGNIEHALNDIIEIQNSLIGGRVV